MKIDVNELLHSSYVVSIDDRRLELFNRVMQAELGCIPKHVKGCTDKKVIMQWKRCNIGHYNAVKRAYESNAPYSLIFEDDAYPCIGVKQKLKNYLDDVPYDCELLQLGWVSLDKGPYEKKVKQVLKSDEKYRLLTTNGIWGAQAYIMTHDMCKKYIDLAEKTSFNTRSDWFYSFTHHAYVLNKSLFIQYSFTGQAMNFSKAGYVFLKTQSTPPCGFKPVEQYIKIERSSSK